MAKAKAEERVAKANVKERAVNVKVGKEKVARPKERVGNLRLR